MLPAATCDKVAAPAMAQLVGNYVYILTVAADDGWGRERENGVFHTFYLRKYGENGIVCCAGQEILTYLRRQSWGGGRARCTLPTGSRRSGFAQHPGTCPYHPPAPIARP